MSDSDYEFEEKSDDDLDQLELEEQSIIDDEDLIEEVEQLNEILEDREEYLMQELARDNISDNEMDLEKLVIKLTQYRLNKVYDFNDEDIEKIQLLETKIKENNDKFQQKEIDLFTYRKNYTLFLQKEIELFDKNESTMTKGKNIKDIILLDTPEKIIKRLIQLEKKESKYLEKIAKENQFEYPPKPILLKYFKRDSSEIKIIKQYANKLKIRVYLRKIEVIENKIKENFIPSYKLRVISSVVSPSSKIIWEEIIPTKIKFENLKKEIELGRKEKENIEKLRQIVQEQTVCDTDLPEIKKLTYIERLRNNRVPVLKFVQNPNSVEDMRTKLKDFFKKIKNEVGLENEIYFELKSDKANLQDIKNGYQLYSDIPGDDGEEKPYIKKPPDFREIDYIKVDGKKKQIFEELGIKTSPLMKGLIIENFGYYKNYKNNNLITVSLKKDAKDVPLEFDEKGEVINLSEKYYDFIKPIPNELYCKLKSLPKGSQDKDIATVTAYQLHYRIANNEYIVIRFEDFESYLLELLNIMKYNAKQIENKSLSTYKLLKTKINIIEQYLRPSNPELLFQYEKLNEDIDSLKNLIFRGRLSETLLINEEVEKNKEELIKKQKELSEIRKKDTSKIDIEDENTFKDVTNVKEIFLTSRQFGLNNLESYIFQFYPDSALFVNNLENLIFNYTKSNKIKPDDITQSYYDNILTIIFIFSTFPDILNDFINDKISFLQLINLEIPEINPNTLEILKPEDIQSETLLDLITSNKLIFKNPNNVTERRKINYFTMLDDITGEISLDKGLEELKKWEPKNNLFTDELENNILFQKIKESDELITKFKEKNLPIDEEMNDTKINK